MIRKYVLPLLALGMLLFAVYRVVLAQQAKPKVEPPVAPARAPFADGVAGAGIVEAQTENIAVGANLPGVVTEVLVRVGDRVKPGQALFRLDDRQLRAERKIRLATLASARAQLDRLKRQPRPEELPAAEARVREARANLADQEDQLSRSRQLIARGAIGTEEMVRRQQAAQAARAQLNRAEAELNLLKAGAWAPDLEVARAAVEQARAQLEQTETELERLQVQALVPGEVLQVNVRPGEYVGAPPGQALIVLGNVDRLHVRVDIDENDIPRFHPGTPARAMLRGDPRREFELMFVRVEPYVIPKRSLTGDNTERVDTRVLQVIYALETRETRVYVGQQLDVSINTEGP